MEIPEPRPGLVVRYSYLWRDEARQGREEGAKDRPCVVVLVVEMEGKAARVRVAPITHTPPDAPGSGVEIPAQTKRRLGLDAAPSWIITTETNVFTWPGPDLRPADRNKAVFGLIAGDTFRKVRDSIIANIRGRPVHAVERDEPD
jgi:hypothetical protein